MKPHQKFVEKQYYDFKNKKKVDENWSPVGTRK